MSAYLDGDLDGEERGRIERHLHDCHQCREILRTLRTTLAALARLGTSRSGSGESEEEPEVASLVLAGVREGIAEEEGGDGRDV